MDRRTLDQLAAYVGVPEISAIRTETDLYERLVPAAIAGLMDGDQTVLHEKFEDPHAVRLYGEVDFSKGQMARAILQAAQACGNRPGVMHYFQSQVAQLCAATEEAPPSDMRAPIGLYPEVLMVDGEPVVLPRPPRVVADLTACLGSRAIIDAQLRIAKSGEQPFRIYAPARTHFMNHMLHATYDQRYGMGAADEAVRKRYYLGRDDAADIATKELLRACRTKGTAADMMDIILCTETHHLTVPQLRQSIMNAYPLLRQGGTLVLRSLVETGAASRHMRGMLRQAYAAGFQRRNTLTFRNEVQAATPTRPTLHAVTFLLGK